ncbi:MAG: protein tyrosine phosphatase family protein [Planctomycetota bacterium]|jgi:uncharacterized protein (TIGR01244 family)
MRFLTILLAALVVGHAGCERAAEPEVIAAEAELVAAEPVSGWPGTKKVSRVGRIFFAGQPGEAGLRQAAAEGVGLVINSRTTQEMARVPFDEPALVAELGMRYVAIPVAPSTFSAADVDRFAEALATTEGPVLFHCATANRSGGLWAAYLVRTHGVAWETALELGQAAGLSRQSMIEAARRVAEGL